jgi:type VI secretion system secreted protein VgrG
LTIQVDNQFIQVSAKEHIILQVGDSSITLTPDGIEIRGKSISTVSSGTTQITGSQVRVND